MVSPFSNPNPIHPARAGRQRRHRVGANWERENGRVCVTDAPRFIGEGTDAESVNGNFYWGIKNTRHIDTSTASPSSDAPYLPNDETVKRNHIVDAYTKYMKKTKMFFSKLHPNTPIIITNHQTAEMVKYANNSFLATKISFINQLSNICQNIPEANIDDIAKTIGLDPRIGKLFLNAGPGYGGSCLPKDMKALISFANDVGVKPVLLNAVEEINEKQLEQIVKLVKRKLKNVTSKNITIMGTAFKPDTDDVRDSLSIELIRKFLKMKAKITVYDPKATNNTKKIFDKKIIYKNSVNEALEKSECVIFMTHWRQFEKIDDRSIKHMKRKLIIDCRRIFAEKNMGKDYFALGIGQ